MARPWIGAVVGVFVAATLPMANALQAQEAGALRAGAAKVDITPKDLKAFYAVWATRYTGVHDPIFARALVVDNGHTRAALVATDLVEFGDTTALRARIEKELGIPADHVMITASHDHGAPRGGPITAGSSSAHGRPYSPPDYIRLVDDKIVEAVRQAQGNERPAEVGVGTGRSDININRNHYNGKTWGGPDYDRPSDKTVWVVKFTDLTGEPIAIVMNYGVHSVVAGPESHEITGDLAGVTERVIETHYGDKAVALWTLGPAGDQNPRYLGDASSRRDGPDFNYKAMEAQGTVVGIEAFQTADAISRMTGTVTLSANQSAFTCAAMPQKAPPPRPAGAPELFPPNPDFHEVIPAPDQKTIQLSDIRLNDIAFVGVSGEVFAQLYLNLKKVSPLANTIMVTMTNDRVGYIADDAAYDGPYTNAEIQRGCAESGIVNGLVKLVGEK